MWQIHQADWGGVGGGVGIGAIGAGVGVGVGVCRGTVAVIAEGIGRAGIAGDFAFAEMIKGKYCKCLFVCAVCVFV